MQQLMVLIRMALRLCLRNKLVVISMIIFPVLSTFLIAINMGGLGSSGFSQSKLVVYAPVSSVYSETVIHSLQSTSAINVVQLTTKEAGSNYMSVFRNDANAGEANLFLYIPANVGSRIHQGSRESLILYDTGNDQRSGLVKSVLAQILTRLKTFDSLSRGNAIQLAFMLKAADASAIQGTAVSAFGVAGAQNPRKAETFSLVIGFFSWFAIWGSSYAVTTIMREKQLKVYLRILLAGTGVVRYLSSKFIISALIGIVQVALMLISFKYVVHADYMIHLWQLGLLLFGFILGAISLNFAIVSFCVKEQHVTLVSIIVINVMAMISGSYWPYEFMPQWMRSVAYFTPQRWIIYTIGRILVHDANALLEYGLVTLGFIALFASIALLGFRYRAKLEA